MIITFWFIVIGLLLITMALGESFLSRLPLTTSLLYLIVGVILGPYGVGMLSFSPVNEAPILHHLAEVAVIVSLFTAGLKLRVHWRDRRWWLPIRLAALSMLLTVGLIALIAMPLLGFTLGSAVLLGAVLALRRVEAMETHGDFDEAIEKLEQHPEQVAKTGEDAPLHIAQEILGFTEQLGRIGEVALVVAIGSMLTLERLSWEVAAFVVVLLVVVRPVAALLGLAGWVADTSLLVSRAALPSLAGRKRRPAQAAIPGHRGAGGSRHSSPARVVPGRAGLCALS